MRSLHIDIETYCEIDLKKAGAYRYAEEAEIILFAYAYDDEPTIVIDLLQGEQIPEQVMDDLTDPFVIKKAFNAAFEISNISQYFNLGLKFDQWEDTQVLAAMTGLPLALEQAASVLRLAQQKDKEGTALIRYFCVPIKKPIAKNNFRTRNLPEHDLEKWERFKIYNGKDVDAERAVCRTLSFYKISEFEKRAWQLDQKINKNGVGINIPFVRRAITLINTYEDRLTNEARQITGLDNPKSIAQLKKWLFEETGEEVDKLNKDSIPEILKGTDSAVVKRILEIRQESSKTSTKKYPRMLDCVCTDGRVRGVHHYYGANRTGRCGHRLIQTGNFPQGNIENIEPVRDLVMMNDPEWLEYTYGPIPDTLSSLLRSALIPAPGHRFIISDLASIEARVLAWLAGEEWVLEVFRTHGKIYEATASRMFNVPLESIGKKSDYRKKGKIASLLLGYQGAAGALLKMGAHKLGITEEEFPVIVSGWRNANPNIVNFWAAVQQGMLHTVGTGEPVQLHDITIRGEYRAPNRGMGFRMVGKSLFFRLPSGRELVYCNAGIEEGEYGPKIIYWGTNQTSKKWCKIDTYGGKGAENCLIGETKVLSLQGWIKLTDVTPHTKLWDGHEWVLSDGVVYKGIQETIDVNGVRMTKNHEIRTNFGWKEASSVSGFNREEVQLPDCSELRRIERQEILLECPVRLRRRKNVTRKRIAKTENKILRLYEVEINRRGKPYSRNDRPSRLLGMAVDGRPLQTTYAPSLAQLRRTRDSSMRPVEKVPEFLGRYGAYLQKKINAGAYKCQWQLRTSELHLDNYEMADAQQTRKPFHKYTLGTYNGSRGLRTVGSKFHNNTIPKSKLVAGSPFTIKTGFYEPVFDIVNCGPKNQFVVRDGDGAPFIVHNCTQAVARDGLMHGLQLMDNAGYKIVLHVHDEAVCEMQNGIGSLAEVVKLMTTNPDWATGLPLQAAGEESFYYKK